MASSRRLERLQSLIEREAATIFQNGLNDPRIGPVVVTHVKISRDLRYCTISVHPRGTEAQKRTTLRGLESSSRVVQGKLGDTLQLRYTPQVRFALDKGVEKAVQMEELFKVINQENSEENGVDSCQNDTEI